MMWGGALTLWSKLQHAVCMTGLCCSWQPSHWDHLFHEWDLKKLLSTVFWVRHLLRVVSFLKVAPASFWDVISALLSLFLPHRFGVYVPLCCFHQDSRAQPLPADCGYLVQDQMVEDGASAVSSLVKPKDFLSLLWESLREQFNNPTSIPTHSCPLSPDLIRNEVECLKADFNRRIKEVLFNSLFSAYYVAFLPLCFVKVALVRFPCAPVCRFLLNVVWFAAGPDSWLIPLFSVSPLAARIAEHGCIRSALVLLLVGG